MTPTGRREAGYMARYRDANPDKVAANSAGIRARGRALRRLGAAHPDELEALLAEEREREGLPPVDKARRPGPGLTSPEGLDRCDAPECDTCTATADT